MVKEYDLPADEQESILAAISDFGPFITYNEFYDNNFACYMGLTYDYIYGQLRFFSMTEQGVSAVDSSGRRVLLRRSRFKKLRTDAFRFERTTGWEDYLNYTMEENK
mgnify:FL=1